MATSRPDFANIVGFNISAVGGRFYFRNQRMRRVTELTQLWDFYHGEHWSYATMPKNVDAKDKVTVNMCFPLVNKLVSFLFGKGVNFTVEDDTEKFKVSFVDAVWKDNDRDNRLNEIGQTGTVGGDVFAYVTLDAAQEKIKLRIYDERFVDPIWDEEDPTKLKEVSIIVPIYNRNPDAPGSDLAPVLGEGDVEVTIRKIVITPEQIWVYEDDKLLPDYPKANALKEIPLVHIPNMVVAMENRGLSSIKPVLHLQHQYNDRFSDIEEILAYHAAPITVVQGAKVSQLEKGARKVWGGLPKDGKVYNLELTSDLSAALAFLSLVKRHMHEIIGVPEAVLGQERAISNTSGVAISLEYQPLTDVNNMRKGTYGSGLERICRLFMRYAEIYPKAAKYYSFEKSSLSDEARTRYAINAEFPDPLPKDELANLNAVILKVTNKLLSRFNAIKELGYSDPQKIIDEIAAETMSAMEQQAEVMKKFPGVAGPVGPDGKQQPVDPSVLQQADKPAGAADVISHGRNGVPTK